MYSPCWTFFSSLRLASSLLVLCAGTALCGHQKTVATDRAEALRARLALELPGLRNYENGMMVWRHGLPDDSENDASSSQSPEEGYLGQVSNQPGVYNFLAGASAAPAKSREGRFLRSLKRSATAPALVVEQRPVGGNSAEWRVWQQALSSSGDDELSSKMSRASSAGSLLSERARAARGAARSVAAPASAGNDAYETNRSSSGTRSDGARESESQQPSGGDGQTSLNNLTETPLERSSIIKRDQSAESNSVIFKNAESTKAPWFSRLRHFSHRVAGDLFSKSFEASLLGEDMMLAEAKLIGREEAIYRSLKKLVPQLALTSWKIVQLALEDAKMQLADWLELDTSTLKGATPEKEPSFLRQVLVLLYGRLLEDLRAALDSFRDRLTGGDQRQQLGSLDGQELGVDSMELGSCAACFWSSRKGSNFVSRSLERISETVLVKFTVGSVKCLLHAYGALVKFILRTTARAGLPLARGTVRALEYVLDTHENASYESADASEGPDCGETPFSARLCLEEVIKLKWHSASMAAIGSNNDEESLLLGKSDRHIENDCPAFSTSFARGDHSSFPGSNGAERTMSETLSVPIHTPERRTAEAAKRFYAEDAVSVASSLNSLNSLNSAELRARLFPEGVDSFGRFGDFPFG